MKKINLEKQKIVSLSDDELANVKGGGLKRSNRRGGDCGYSRRYPDAYVNAGGGCDVVGCRDKDTIK